MARPFALAWLFPFLVVACEGLAADPELRIRLDDRHAVGRDFWIYNDIPAAMAQARRLNKPVFVTFRCVPCKACEAFDAEVAQGSDRIADFAREHFVSVRQVEMEGVDLSQFQFDFDLNWAAVFLHPDGTIYARYGTQSADGPDTYNSVEGLLSTMQRVVELHRQYPGNVSELQGKKPPKSRYRTAIELPGLEQPERFEGITTRKSCIHCHMIFDAENRVARDEGIDKRTLFERYPLPESLGLSVDPGNGTTVTDVLPGSPADKAGLSAGETLTHVQGQAVTSVADIQWALHQQPRTDTTIELRTRDHGNRTLQLNEGWKQQDITWRGSLWSISPVLRMWAQAAPEKREEAGAGEGEGVFIVRYINAREPGGKAVQKAGIRVNDLLVAFEGRPLPMDFKTLLADMKQRYDVGDAIPLTIVRDGQRRDVLVKAME